MLFIIRINNNKNIFYILNNISNHINLLKKDLKQNLILIFILRLLNLGINKL